MIFCNGQVMEMEALQSVFLEDVLLSAAEKDTLAAAAQVCRVQSDRQAQNTARGCLWHQKLPLNASKTSHTVMMMMGSQSLATGCMGVSVMISGAVRVPEVSLRDSPVYLRFSLPAMYPLVMPALQACFPSSSFKFSDFKVFSENSLMGAANAAMSQSAHLQVECNASRDVHDALTKEVTSCAEEHAGIEVLLVAVDCLLQAIQNLPLQVCKGCCN